MSEKKWDLADRRNTYTLFDGEESALDINWHWDLYNEVLLFDRLWEEGESMTEISRILEKSVDSVQLLKIDRMKRNKITKRQYDDYGNIETFLQEFVKPKKRSSTNA